ncbi:hypothetical protein [Streptomyces sp. NPDC007883]|uniref:hypothetical protein n=1 Tax=Streptomyces sp. NPDC007883 TaxID=3155116 RepID=UPI0033F2F699
MTDWSRLCDAYGSAERTPELLDCLGAGAGEEVWRELWGRLCHQGTVSSASFAAIPRLAEVARHGQSDDSSRALVLAGAIMRGALQNHGADDVILLCSAAVEDLRRLADERLVDRPDGYLGLFSVLLALEGHALWSEVIDDFTDDFYEVGCPHCASSVTVAIGDHGHYSSIRDWHRGDVHRLPLRPIGPDRLRGVGRRMYETAVRDAQDKLARGITHLFGCAECGECGSVFNVADEYSAANSP